MPHKCIKTRPKSVSIKNEALNLCNARTSLSHWIKFPITTQINGVIKSIIA